MKAFLFTITMPIRVTLQDEEYEDCQRELAERRAMYQREGFPQTGLTIERIVMERAQHTATEALQIGATQYEGALIVVESRVPVDGETQATLRTVGSPVTPNPGSYWDRETNR